MQDYRNVREITTESLWHMPENTQLARFRIMSSVHDEGLVGVDPRMRQGCIFFFFFFHILIIVIGGEKEGKMRMGVMTL